MLDVAPSEFLLLAVVALLVIGPKDLPKAMRVVGYWVGRARGVARQFRTGFDNMVRESELAEMEKKWAEENERIMREHGSGGSAEAPASADLGVPALSDAAGGVEGAGGDSASAISSDGVADPVSEPDLFADPVTVEHPHVEPGRAAAADSKASS